MKTVNIHEAKTQLSNLVDEVQSGQDVIIARYGKPLAKLTALEPAAERSLGFYPIRFESDLCAPTDDSILSEFETSPV